MITLSSICILLSIPLIIMLYKLWWIPFRVRRSLESQGIKGPPYRFFHGNTKEIIQMTKQISSTPMDLSHDIFPRSQPHLYSWSKIYGDVYVFWMGVTPCIVLTDPQLIREILNNKQGNFSKMKTDDYLKKLLGDGILVAEGGKWSKLRKLANHAFNGDCLKDMTPAMISSARTMVDRWRNYVGKEIEVCEQFRLLTAEVISRTAFGSSYLEGIFIFETITKFITLISRNTFNIRFDGFKRLIPSKDDIEVDRVEQQLRDSILKVVNKREAEASKGQNIGFGNDFLGSLLNVHHDMDPKNRVSIDEIVDECKTFYSAGQETTASLLCWSIVLLGIHTDWQEKARKEVIELFGQETPHSEGIARLKTGQLESSAMLICQYVFCPISGKPSAEYLPMACSLSTGKVYNLAAMLLGSFYRGMNSCVAKNPLSTLGGVAWILQLWAAAYFSKLFSFPTSAGPLSTILLMQGQLESSVTEFVKFLQSGTFDELTPPPRPHVGSFDQSWVVAYPSFRDDSPEFVFDTLLTACVHHRFLIVDCLGARSPIVARANVGWSFEFYNSALFARQFGISHIPHSVLYYPLDLSHLYSEIDDGHLSRATVDLFSGLPSHFRSPIRVCAPEEENPFPAWWASRCAVLAPMLNYPSAKSKKYVALVEKPTEPSSAQVKSKKRKTSSAPSHPVQRSKGRKYSTRSSSRLQSRFSNIDADPVDLISSPPTLDADDDNSEDDGTPRGSPTADELIDDYFLQGQDIGSAPESSPPSIPLAFSSRKAQLQELEGPSSNADLSFADDDTSASSQLAKSFPSAESLSYARAAVRNFLELGLHQLGDSQRLAMISAASILKASPDFSSEHFLMDNISDIFCDSDVAQSKLTSLIAKRESFNDKRRQAEAMEKENSFVRDRIRDLTVEYDASEIEVQRLEKEILEHRSRMASILDEAKSLKTQLLSGRSATKAVVEELASLKDDYGDWMKEMRDSEAKQSECLLKLEQLHPKSKKYVALVEKPTEPSSAQVKSKKRKTSSAPSHPVQRSKGRKYSTRSSSRLQSRFSNIDADPVDLISSPPTLDADDDNSEDDGTPRGSPTADELIDDYFLQGQDIGSAPESSPPSIPLAFSSRKAQLQELEGPSSNADLSFADDDTSASSQLAKSFPSAESLSYARAAVRNFLELGLHQLGDSQRLAMISAASILKASPDFSSEYFLLDSIAAIFYDSDAAQTKLTSLMAKRESFHDKRRQAEAMEKKNSSVRDRIRDLTVEYDANEIEVQRLEKEILERRSRMASILDEAESLKTQLLSGRSETKAVVEELASLKDDYGGWMKEMRDSEEKENECLLRWEKLHRALI
ncbi:hypothetical protein F511_24093 [Dorcoceras hygrometricum]|uniref:Uncharacterized protein n=1 Tax=Dorcoceras hygrometricum TaxID=472368 RepID=A0A2Z7BVB1_9LAMI|nr:hypothetical protein F511_24093 [Dorcoceras hygrometricum]